MSLYGKGIRNTETASENCLYLNECALNLITSRYIQINRQLVIQPHFPTSRETALI